MKIPLFLTSILAVLIGTGLYGQTSKPSKKDEVVILSTSYGDMYIVLFDETPKHKENFLKLAKEGFYDGTTFHRVIKNFMIQGGDPNSKEGGEAGKIGQGGPGYTIDAEFVSKYKHNKGALAAARQGDQVNPKRASSGSQFYLVHSPNGCKHLNGSYTVFGQVVKGLDLIDEVAKAKVDKRKGNVPEESIRVNMTVKSMSKKKIAQMYGEELLY
ncbi:MAG: peptidylprolyl isomerase [Bacteroidota bacterium]